MNTPSLHTLVHIGAGSGSQLSHYAELNPARVILIEPLPSQAKALRQITADMPNTEVWELAISAAANGQPAKLTEYNLTNASSLHKATGLATLFPGLKSVQQHLVQTITPQGLIQRLQLNAEHTNKLVVDANGEEAAIIQALLQADQLALFSQLQLTMPAVELYQNSHNPNELQQQLQDYGYDLLTIDNNDPDLPQWHLALNPVRRELEATQKQRDQLQQQNTAIAAQQQELQAQIQAETEAKQRVTTQAEQLKQQLAEAQHQLTDQQALLQAQQEQTQAETDAKQRITAQAEQLKQQLAEAEAQLKDQQTKHLATTRSWEALKQQHATLTTQLTEARAESTTLEANLDSNRTKLANAEQTAKDQTKTLEETQEELNKYKTYFANRKQQHEEAQLRIAELEGIQAEQQTRINELRQQLQAAQNSETKLNNLEQKLEQMFSQQAQQIQQNTNALGQHISKTQLNSNQQLQAFMGVQHSLHHGDLPLSYHGWAINADLALQLVQKIQHNQYDVVIEFGSGTSTQMFAKAILNKVIGNTSQNLALQHVQNKSELSEFVAPNELDLPKRVISFEHNKKYYQQTLQNLQQQGLAQVVDLNHAPLVDYQEQGMDYLFYDCKSKLKQLAQIFSDREAHILVLVDGPSASKEEAVVRYPALPHVLKHLSAHRLDIVLDDYQRTDEQTVAEQWRAQLKKRDLHFSEQTLPCEKGALLLSINQ